MVTEPILLKLLICMLYLLPKIKWIFPKRIKLAVMARYWWGFNKLLKFYLQTCHLSWVNVCCVEYFGQYSRYIGLLIFSSEGSSKKLHTYWIYLLDIISPKRKVTCAFSYKATLVKCNTVYNSSEQTSSLQSPWGSVRFAESYRPSLNLLRCLCRNLVKCKSVRNLMCVLKSCQHCTIDLCNLLLNMYMNICMLYLNGKSLLFWASCNVQMPSGVQLHRGGILKMVDAELCS